MGVYVRIGSTNRRADALIIKEMERVAANKPFDEQPMPEVNSEAIDFLAASEHFKPIKKLSRPDLESLGLVTAHQKRKVATVGGVLLFSDKRNELFPDAWIQAGRFKGVNKQHIIDNTVINTHLVDAINIAMQFVEKHALNAIEIHSLKHTKAWSIPHAAVREALINAVVHADYSQQGSPIRVAIFDDRIEIENPGLLPFGITVEDIKNGVSKLRNRVIGRVFHRLGYIEQWGSGVQRIISICKEGGFLEPTFEEMGTHFRVTISTVKAGKRLVAEDKTEQNILNLLEKEQDGLPTKDIANCIGLTTRATRTRLSKLIDKGKVVAIGATPNDPSRRYYLTKAR